MFAWHVYVEVAEEERIPAGQIPAPVAQTIYDPDLDAENLVEMKHRCLTRSLRTPEAAIGLQPNGVEIDKLHVCSLH